MRNASGTYIDNELNDVYLVELENVPLTALTLQKEEVTGMRNLVSVSLMSPPNITDACFVHFTEYEKRFEAKDTTYVLHPECNKVFEVLHQRYMRTQHA